MNPAIVDEFARLWLEKGSVAWEPFAGHSSPNRSVDICALRRVRLIAYDIAPVDEMVVCADSTRVGPGEPIQGAIFNPPYIGTSPMSMEEGELSVLGDDEYFDALRRTVSLIHDAMRSGKVCTVGRTVLVAGRRVYLDWLFALLFLNAGFRFVAMLSSVPDWVVVLEK